MFPLSNMKKKCFIEVTIWMCNWMTKTRTFHFNDNDDSRWVRNSLQLQSFMLYFRHQEDKSSLSLTNVNTVAYLHSYAASTYKASSKSRFRRSVTYDQGPAWRPRLVRTKSSAGSSQLGWPPAPPYQNNKCFNIAASEGIVHKVQRYALALLGRKQIKGRYCQGTVISVNMPTPCM